MGRRPSANPAYGNVVKVTDEAWIAQRAAQQRPTWYLFKLGDKWPRCSLGTADLREARSLALKAYQAWLDDAECDWRAACGNTSHHVSFKTVAEEWLATQKTASVVRKFLLPFFDEERGVTSMTMVTQAMIDDYKVWEKAAGRGDRHSCHGEAGEGQRGFGRDGGGGTAVAGWGISFRGF